MEKANSDALVDDIRQYVAIKEQMTLLTARQNELKKALQKAVTELGEVDGRGHQVLEIDDPVSGVKALTNQRRVSKSLDMETAEKILTDKDIIEDCLEFIPTLNEEAIMAAFYKGELTEDDIDAMFPSKVSYAFII